MKNLSVPLMKQGQNECGPTALNMVLNYLGENFSIENIVDGIGGIKSYGIETIKLAEFAKKLGFKVICYSYNEKLSQGKFEIKKPSKKNILKFLNQGTPIILAVRSYLLFDEEPSEEGHFIVLVGYENNKFTYNDPYDGKQKNIDEDKLMKALEENSLDSSAYLLIIKPK
ncbi:C39 family peptidase [Candidatus Pacearchaeota archaeon]|nr:C39 family peptidase [Candidatus Pacearchaeota archaeon]